jgi:hypothetical protein
VLAAAAGDLLQEVVFSSSVHSAQGLLKPVLHSYIGISTLEVHNFKFKLLTPEGNFFHEDQPPLHRVRVRESTVI